MIDKPNQVPYNSKDSNYVQLSMSATSNEW